jgi:RND family efflux transporter MFP subunit
MNFARNSIGKFFTLLLYVCAISWLAACSNEKESNSIKASVPWVVTVPIHLDNQSALALSGTVRARFETPVAFQLSGRIAARHVNAGQQVEKEQILFKLDTRDLKQSIKAAEAEQAAAQAALATAKADIERDRKLVAENFISRQAMERTALVAREARTRLNAAQAQLKQAHNALDYADLRAESAGVLIEVSGEPGQVVNFGQPIAVLAHDGKREVEVFFPENIKPRQAGNVYLADGGLLNLKLRESAGAANLASRTWRARYRIMDKNHSLSLGEVVRTTFKETTGTSYRFKVPLGALDERGEGVRIWQLQDNQAQPIPAKIFTLDTEHAWITANLSENSRIIALGTHLLEPGMAVQALAQ